MTMRYLPNVVSLELNPAPCVGCAMCTYVCPHAVFVIDGRRSKIVDRDACMECGACARNCPVNAIKVAAGTGCATGLINSALGRKGDCCCTDETNRPGCATEEPAKPGCCGDSGSKGCCG